AAFHNYNEIRYYNGIPAKADIPAEKGIDLIHGYRACVSYADAQIGQILNELKSLGLDKNTIVVLIGDHGWSLGDHNQWCKHSNFNIVNNAPLIMRTPGNKKKGAEAKVVEFVDIYPTLCEEAGIPIPAHTEGSSFSKLLHGKDAAWKDCAIVKWHKGVSYFDRSHGYTEWRNQNNELEDQMLFIYSNDPAETRNVADDPKNEELINRLQKKIEEHRGKNFFVKTARPEPRKKAKK
ncbi:MAG: sulfatase-like hydrolase/transferase, partial [Bacteroidales bacterium]